MRRVLILVLASLLGCSLAATATAGLPDPIHSTVQGPYLSVEGFTDNPPAGLRGACTTARCPDGCVDGRCGDFLVVARDFANNPVPGAIIQIDFHDCSDIVISCDQLTAETGQTLGSPGVVQGVTDAAGRFTFRVQGQAKATLEPTGTSPGTNMGVPCARIFQDGVQLSTEIVSAYDVNGGGSPGGVNGADVAIVATEVVRVLSAGAQGRARDDYNYNGTVNGADVALSARMVVDATLGSGSRTTGGFCP